MRIEFSPRVKREAAKRADGKCEGCGLPRRSGEAHYDHINPEYFSKDATLENCQVLCWPCHRDKTGKVDVPAIAKSKRIWDRENGIRPNRRKIASHVDPWGKGYK